MCEGDDAVKKDVQRDVCGRSHRARWLGRSHELAVPGTGGRGLHHGGIESVKPVWTEAMRQAVASQRHSWPKRRTRDKSWLLLG